MSRRSSKGILLIPPLVRRVLRPTLRSFCTCDTQAPLDAPLVRTTTIVDAAGPQPVVSLLKSHGFHDSQITDLLSRRQRYLSHPSEVPALQSTLRILRSWGFTKSQVRELILLDFGSPYRMLDEQELRRLLHFLDNIVGDEEKIAEVIRRHDRLLKTFRFLMRNTTQLVKHSVPTACVSELMISCPKVLSRNPDKVGRMLETMGSFGIGPDSPVFVEAFTEWGRLSTSEILGKRSLFASMGWSEDKVVGVVSRAPSVMVAYNGKIELVNCLLTEKANWETSPARSRKMAKFMSFHLGKAIPRRLAVLKVLKDNDLVGKDDFEALFSSFFLGNNAFMNEYVWRYIGQVPNVEDVYNEETEMKTAGIW